MTGSNIFRIFKHGVGLIKGGFTAVVKFSNANEDNKIKTLEYNKNSWNYQHARSEPIDLSGNYVTTA